MTADTRKALKKEQRDGTIRVTDRERLIEELMRRDDLFDTAKAAIIDKVNEVAGTFEAELEAM